MKKPENLYIFENNSFDTRGFTWAISLIPRSDMVYRVCPDCGGVENYPAGAFDVIVEGGTRYPDVLGCGAYPFLILSEAVITAWNKAGVTCFQTYPVEIAQVKSKKLRMLTPPRYFRVEIDGQCQIDLVASGVDVIRVCPVCQRVIERPTYPFVHGYQMIPGSWDGCAVFRDVLLYPRVSFCTGLILEIACKQRFTNFRFTPMQAPLNPASKGIDYLKGSCKS